MEPDVVVVGGGAIGTTVAYELARRGTAVALLERGDRLAAGCSAGNAGLISPSHSLPLASPEALRDAVRSLLGAGGSLSVRRRPRSVPWLVRFAGACRAGRVERGLRTLRELSAASLALHADLAGLGTSFERRGIVSAYLTEAAFDGARAEAGPGAQVLDAAAAAELEPALRPTLAGAVLTPDEAQVDPLRYVEAVGAAAAEAGATVRTHVEVRALRRRHGSLTVVTAAGELRPRTVVLAAGAATAALARGLGLVVPVAGGKGYHVELAAADGDPRLPILVPEARCAVTPLDGRLRLTGTIELCTDDLGVDTRRLGTVRAAAERVLRGAGGRPAVGTWAGLRPCAPDGLPVIGESDAVPGLVVATGHAFKGIALAPVTALLVAELVTGGPPSHDLSELSPDRFRPLLRRR